MPNDWTSAAIHYLDPLINNRIERVARSVHEPSREKLDEVIDALNELRQDFAKRDTLDERTTYKKIKAEFTTAVELSHQQLSSQLPVIARNTLLDHIQRSGVSIAAGRLQELSVDFSTLFEKQYLAATSESAQVISEEPIDQFSLLTAARDQDIQYELAWCKVVNDLRDAYHHIMHAETAATQAKNHEQTHARLRGVHEAIADLRQNRTEQALELLATKDKVRVHSKLLDDQASEAANLVDRLSNLEAFTGITDEVSGKALSVIPPNNQDHEQFHDTLPSPRKTINLQLAGIQQTLTVMHRSIEKLIHDVQECQNQNDDIDRRLRKVELLAQPDLKNQELTHGAGTSAMDRGRPFDRFEAHLHNHPPKRTGLPLYPFTQSRLDKA